MAGAPKGSNLHYWLSLPVAHNALPLTQACAMLYNVNPKSLQQEPMCDKAMLDAGTYGQENTGQVCVGHLHAQPQKRDTPSVCKGGGTMKFVLNGITVRVDKNDKNGWRGGALPSRVLALVCACGCEWVSAMSGQQRMRHLIA